MSLEEASTSASKKKNSGLKVGYCPDGSSIHYPLVVPVEQEDGSVIGQGFFVNYADCKTPLKQVALCMDNFTLHFSLQ